MCGALHKNLFYFFLRHFPYLPVLPFRMDNQRLIALLEKYESGTLDAEERALLESWYLNESGKRLHAIGDTELWNRLTALDKRLPLRYPTRTWRLRPRIVAAAAMILAALAGTWVFLEQGSRINEQGQRSKEQGLAAADIAPGDNRATLTLADGRMVDLSPEQSGIIVGDGITYLDGSSVLSEQVNKLTSEQADKAEQNDKLTNSQVHNLTTPKGGTYSITLPDGTKVWLNAASTLKYPSRFSGDERIVELEGEAFFEVRKTGSPEDGKSGSQKIPFKVITNGQTVEVLGTKFNISAYPDEQEVKTTLVEGKVRVKAAAIGVAIRNTQYTILSPKEQAITREAHTIIQQVDVQQFTAWRGGTFRFDDTPLVDIMRQVSRWYDVEVDYSQLPDKRITGVVSRGERLSAVLRALAISSNVHFILQGRRLLLKKE